MKPFSMCLYTHCSQHMPNRPVLYTHTYIIMPHTCTCDRGAAFSITKDSEFFKEPEEVESGLLRDMAGRTLPGTNCRGCDPLQEGNGVGIPSARWCSLEALVSSVELEEPLSPVGFGVRVAAADNTQNTPLFCSAGGICCKRVY